MVGKEQFFQKQSGTKTEDKGKSVGSGELFETPIYSEEEIESWLEEAPERRSLVSAIFVGPKSTGKTGSALELMGDDPRERMIIVEMGQDKGASTLNQEFKGSDPRVKIFNPYKYKFDVAENKIMIDYQSSLNKIKALMVYLKKGKVPGLHTIVIDGVDGLLNLAEMQMRMHYSLEVSDAAKFRFYMMRNRLFDETWNLMQILPYSKIFTNHPMTSDPSRIYGTKDSLASVNQIYTFHKKTEGDTIRLFAKCTEDRTNLIRMTQEYLIAEGSIEGSESSVNFYGVKPIIDEGRRYAEYVLENLE